MKKILSSCIFVSLALLSYGQATITSVASGSAVNPLNWDCTCVPTPTDSIIINHNITLDVDFAVSTGSIVVQSAGKLMGDVPNRILGITGSGHVVNNGTISVGSFGVTSGTGTVMNNGTFTVGTSLYTDAAFTNNGTVNNVDSLYNAKGTFINSSGATLIADQFFTTGRFTNAGNVTSVNFANTDTVMHTGGMSVTNFYNAGYYNISGGSILAGGNWLNGDTLNGTANFINNAYVSIANNFLNLDTIRGLSGRFCVGDSSQNSGAMLGTFDFCDKTPMQPKIDLNLGFMAGSLKYCATPCGVGIKEIAEEELEVYPNPSNGIVNVILNEEFSGLPLNVKVRDVNGRLVKSFTTTGRNSITIDLSEVPGGLYMMSLAGSDYVYTKKIQILY